MKTKKFTKNGRFLPAVARSDLAASASDAVSPDRDSVETDRAPTEGEERLCRKPAVIRNHVLKQ